MELSEIIEQLSNPEKLISPERINILSAHLNGYITDLEEQEWEDQLRASNKKMELYTEEKTNASAETKWKTTSEFAEWKKTERLVRRLKRFRADLKDRFQVLTNTKRF